MFCDTVLLVEGETTVVWWRKRWQERKKMERDEGGERKYGGEQDEEDDRQGKDGVRDVGYERNDRQVCVADFAT